MKNNQKVLIVDDESSLLLGLSATMLRGGYDVILAENGEEGLSIAKDEIPDLIVSDVMMPPPNGFELRKIMSEDPKLANIPFIFLTARTDLKDKIEGMRIGADDYITKPFNREELLARVEAVLRRVEVERAKGRDEMEGIKQKEMEKLKHEILQNFQHELRTPLVNIVLPLEAVLKDKFQEPEDQIRFIRMALSNLDRMESLVEDLIILSNLDHGNLNTIRQEIDPEIDIRKTIEKRGKRYSYKNLEIEYDIQLDFPIFAPRNEFKRVLLHLADNAFKFSPENRRIYIYLRSNGAGGCDLRVRDYGPGIPMELREKIFERYYQISQGDNRSYDGLGVGLTISRAIAETLGGSVNFLPTDKGSCFQFLLPPGENEWITN